MAKYILNSNKQDSASGGNYELHNADECRFLPLVAHQLPVGYFMNCFGAKEGAQEQYPEKAADIDGCHWCCPQCHEE
jgi:hypothetical protein